LSEAVKQVDPRLVGVVMHELEAILGAQNPAKVEKENAEARLPRILKGRLTMWGRGQKD